MGKQYITIQMERETGDIVAILDENGRKFSTESLPFERPIANIVSCDQIFWHRSNPTCYYYRGQRHCG